MRIHTHYLSDLNAHKGLQRLPSTLGVKVCLFIPESARGWTHTGLLLAADVQSCGVSL